MRNSHVYNIKLQYQTLTDKVESVELMPLFEVAQDINLIALEASLLLKQDSAGRFCILAARKLPLLNNWLQREEITHQGTIDVPNRLSILDAEHHLSDPDFLWDYCLLSEELAEK